MSKKPPYVSEVADKVLMHLSEPIEAGALSRVSGIPRDGCRSALLALHRKGKVRKIARRKNGMFVAHLWVAA